jgi:hypothetical protein
MLRADPGPFPGYASEIEADLPKKTSAAVVYLTAITIVTMK